MFADFASSKLWKKRDKNICLISLYLIINYFFSLNSVNDYVFAKSDVKIEFFGAKVII